MDLLWWFADIRTDIGDAFFSAITYFGHMLLPMIFTCILYWCYDKKTAYKLGLSFFAGSILLQYVKITFRVPRPWQIDSRFIPVKSALDAATGYSFPSGHSQIAGALYTAFFMISKKKWLRIIMIFLIIIVPISRMYLGVHTLLDVSVGVVIGIAFSILFFTLYDKIDGSFKIDIIVSVIILAVCVGLILYANYLRENVDKTYAVFFDCYKMAGAGIAFAIAYPIEKNLIKFNTETTIFKQIIKAVIGVGILVALRYGIKFILGSTPTYEFIRYFAMGIFMLVLYPITFKYLFKPKEKNENIAE